MTVFIQRGDAPLTEAQAIARGLAIYESEKPLYVREMMDRLGVESFDAWATGWIMDNAVNEDNNRFNHQLAAVRGARARLSVYVLAEGREQVTELRLTGEIDETGEPVTEEVVVVSYVPPFEPATVESVDEEGVSSSVPHPAITQDKAQRNAAYGILLAMPEEVVSFDGV